MTNIKKDFYYNQDNSIDPKEEINANSKARQEALDKAEDLLRRAVYSKDNRELVDVAYILLGNQQELNKPPNIYGQIWKIPPSK